MARIAWGALARLIGRAARDPDDPVPDAELLDRFARDRDPAAFELLVWRHGAMVLGVCRRAVRDDHLAEDAFQAAFLVLARKAGSVRGNLAGWLYRVARRSAARARRLPRNLAPLPPDLPARPTPDAAERADLSAVVDAEIARLPERMRAAVLLCYLGGQSTEDAARALGVPRGTVLSRLAAARGKLAARLTRRGVALPAAGLVAVAGPSELAAVAPPAARAAVAFAAGGSGVSVPVLLAEGLVKAMNIGKLLAAGVVATAIGLATSFGLVAAQGAKPTAEKAVPANPTTAPHGAEPQPPTIKVRVELAEDEHRRRAEQIQKLTKLAEQMRGEIETKELQIRRLVESTAPADTELALRRQQRDYEFERDLATEEIREVAKTAREVRRKISGMPPVDASNEQAIKTLEKSLKESVAEMENAKRKLQDLTNRFDEGVAALQQTIRRHSASQHEAEVMARELDPHRQMLQKLRGEILHLRIEQELQHPVAIPQAPPMTATLDQLLKEVRELREEVRESRKK